MTVRSETAREKRRAEEVGGQWRRSSGQYSNTCFLRVSGSSDTLRVRPERESWTVEGLLALKSFFVHFTVKVVPVKGACWFKVKRDEVG